jgi:hypothetical protein
MATSMNRTKSTVIRRIMVYLLVAVSHHRYR